MDDARQHIASQLVGAEQKFCAGCCHARLDRLRHRVMRRHQVGEHRQQQLQQHQGQGQHQDGVAHKIVRHATQPTPGHALAPARLSMTRYNRSMMALMTTKAQVTTRIEVWIKG